MFAHRNKLRRPWDGQDGYEYNCFKENISVYEFQSMSEESMNRILDNLCNSHEFNLMLFFNSIDSSFIRGVLFDGNAFNVTQFDRV